jgi:MFS family permease
MTKSCSYAVDSMAALIQSVIARQAYLGFDSKGYPTALTMSIYVGMVLGSIVFGLMSDTIGRRFAFNLALAFVAVATLISGAMPSWISLAFFMSLIGVGAAGGIVMDTTIFLEYLPQKQRWLLTMVGIWFGIGQVVVGFLAWAFLCKMTLLISRSGGQRSILCTG